MDPKSDGPDIHFHIRWSRGLVDWEPFSTREEAMKRASERVAVGEAFGIEQVKNSACALCNRKASSAS